jgi:hypothetical protein
MKTMTRNSPNKWFAAAFAVFAALNVALVLAQLGHALPGLPSLFGANMIRAEIVTKSGGVLHDYRVDKGRITAISGRTLTVNERDGTVVSIQVAGATRVTINGAFATFGQLRRGMKVQTIREDDGPAQNVDATRPR